MTMNLLAFDTSTEMMSVAVQRAPLESGETPQVWQHTALGGALTSANLIPTIEGLMAQADLQFAQLDAIAFGSGPGSFTGLRTACAVAQGLAFGAKLKVLPVDSLLCVAEQARNQHAADQSHFRVMALLDARMDEMYGAGFEFKNGAWTETVTCGLIRPEDLSFDPQCALAGNVFGVYGARLPLPLGAAAEFAPVRIDALPTATAMLRLAPALLAAGAAVPPDQALPRYIRDKVAKTTLERAAEKAMTAPPTSS